MTLDRHSGGRVPDDRQPGPSSCGNSLKHDFQKQRSRPGLVLPSPGGLVHLQSRDQLRGHPSDEHRLRPGQSGPSYLWLLLGSDSEPAGFHSLRSKLYSGSELLGPCSIALIAQQGLLVALVRSGHYFDSSLMLPSWLLECSILGTGVCSDSP